MRIGVHVSTSGGLGKAVDRGLEYRCEAIQIFSQSPRQWKPTAHAPEDVERFAEARAKAGLDVVIHASYLINLASPDRDVVDKSVTALAASCELASGIGGVGAVVHVGSHLGSGFESGLKRAQPALQKVLDGLPDGVWLLLENTAGAGGTMGRTMEELAAVAACSDHPRLGVCLDTCHLYATGFDVTDPEAVDDLVTSVSKTFGLRRLKALHLNDSQTPLGSNRDRHAGLGEGQMKARLSAFLGHPKLQGLPALIETGQHDENPDGESVRIARRYWRAGLRARGQSVPRVKTRKPPSGGSKNSGLTQPRTSRR
jgi:deoxyribonuclease-4